VQEGETVIWMDAGPGTFVALWDTFSLDTVSAVIISHEHADHCSDLLSAYHALAHGPFRRPPLTVYCPSPVADRIAGFVRAGEGHALGSVFDFRPVGGGDVVDIGNFEVRFTEMDHSVPTVGSRIQGEHRTLVYSGDTGDGGDWRGLVSEADLFLCEATYQGDPSVYEYTQHLTAAQAGRIAREQGAHRLMLTHVPAHVDAAVSVGEAETVFDRPVALAVPGTVHDL